MGFCGNFHISRTGPTACSQRFTALLADPNLRGMARSCTIWADKVAKGVYLFYKLLPPDDSPRIRGLLVAYRSVPDTSIHQTSNDVFEEAQSLHALALSLNQGASVYYSTRGRCKADLEPRARHISQIDGGPAQEVSDRICMNFTLSPVSLLES